MSTVFKQFFSLDSPKAIKARSFGWMNAINYMAPHRLAGVGDLCGNASPGCIALCLGWHSGQASMVKGGRTSTMNNVRRSRVAKARLLMSDRVAFIAEMIAGIERAERKANREGLKLCVRLNGATDLAWEGMAPQLFTRFAHLQFVDYTKSAKRALAHAAGKMPANYHLTFSRSETNWNDCVQVLCAGGNVAIVSSCPMPALYRGWTCVDGDESDLRHLDASGGERRSLVVWLSPKGSRAKRDKSGFVVRA
jgi:hypothetical protein